VVGAVEAVLTKNHGGRILVVTHSGVLSMIMASFVDGDSKRWRDHWGWEVTGVTELHHQDGQWQLIRQNDVTHLSR
jgi:broad specificity phosphatase PhoE